VLRAVFDANVLVSALLHPEGLPGRLLRRAMSAGSFDLVLSEAIAGELRRVTSYARIRRRVTATEAELAAWLDALSLTALWTESRPVDLAGLADPDDAIYLAAAATGGAHVIVSGDRHLLTLKEFAGMPILTPREFSSLLDAGFIAEPFRAGSFAPQAPAAADLSASGATRPRSRRRRAG
jgi:putative PIN family toxin of toxin-antitoxin system